MIADSPDVLRLRGRIVERFEHELREMILELSGEHTRPGFALRRAKGLLKQVERLKMEGQDGA